MLKKELRKKYKTLRALMEPEEMERKSLEIANQLLRIDILFPEVSIWNQTYFHLYMSIRELREVDTEFILQILAGKDKEVVVSKTDFESLEMTHFLLTDSTKFQKNEYHIYEPIDGIVVPEKKIDVVFVPLVCYDTVGNRVGYGKGFYDRFLAKCKPEVIKIGLSFFEPETQIDDVISSDVTLDFCVTPTGIHSFRGKSF